jgi:hypothetical protein
LRWPIRSGLLDFERMLFFLFGIKKPDWLFGPDAPPWWVTAYAFDHYEAFVGVGVVIWLIGYAIRGVARSMSSGRPA